MIPINQILQGDVLKLIRSLPDNSVDAIITDPPYSSGGIFKCDKTRTTTEKYQVSGTERKYPEFNGDSRDQHSWAYWSTLWLTECLRASKESSPICIFSDWRQLPSLTDALQAAGWIWRGVAAWDKTEAARPTTGRFRQQAEFIAWGSKGSMPANTEIGCLPGVFRYGVKQDDKFHITGKPTPLMRDVVKIVPKNGIILDPFAGSGTTCLAAKLEGRQYIGFELSPEYIEIANKRLDIANVGALDEWVKS